MTDAAAQAKRLYDAEKWAAAYQALSAVATGATGDDEGNRELAAFNAAKALYRLQRLDEAVKAFRSFALRTNHLKHRESLLWMVKLSTDAPTLVRATDFARFDLDTLRMYDNAEQRTLYWQAAYLLGRACMALGDPSKAMELFGFVGSSSAYHDRAVACGTAAHRM